ncbi:MAG: hypothetical protein ACOH2L_08855 [Devosia sp.]
MKISGLTFRNQTALGKIYARRGNLIKVCAPQFARACNAGVAENARIREISGRSVALVFAVALGGGYRYKAVPCHCMQQVVLWFNSVHPLWVSAFCVHIALTTHTAPVS